VPYMLWMTTGKQRDPMALFVLRVAGDRAFHAIFLERGVARETLRERWADKMHVSYSFH